MVVLYIFSAILIVIGAVSLLWGACCLYCGIRDENPWGSRSGLSKLAFAAFLGLVLWAIGFPWDGEWFEWLKQFVAEHAVILRIMAGIFFLTIVLPLIGVSLALIKWLFIDIRKKSSDSTADIEKAHKVLKDRENERSRYNAPERQIND